MHAEGCSCESKIDSYEMPGGVVFESRSTDASLHMVVELMIRHGVAKMSLSALECDCDLPTRWKLETRMVTGHRGPTGLAMSEDPLAGRVLVGASVLRQLGVEVELTTSAPDFVPEEWVRKFGRE